MNYSHCSCIHTAYRPAGPRVIFLLQVGLHRISDLLGRQEVIWWGQNWPHDHIHQWHVGQRRRNILRLFHYQNPERNTLNTSEIHIIENKTMSACASIPFFPLAAELLEDNSPLLQSLQFTYLSKSWGTPIRVLLSLILPFLNKLHLCHKWQSLLRPAPARTWVSAAEKRSSPRLNKPSIPEDATLQQQNKKVDFYVCWCRELRCLICASSYIWLTEVKHHFQTCRASEKFNDHVRQNGVSNVLIQPSTRLVCCSPRSGAGSDPKSWTLQLLWGSMGRPCHRNPPGSGPRCPGSWGKEAAQTELQKSNIRQLIFII